MTFFGLEVKQSKGRPLNATMNSISLLKLYLSNSHITPPSSAIPNARENIISTNFKAKKKKKVNRQNIS